MRPYLSLIFLFTPALAFALFLFLFKSHSNLQLSGVFPFVPLPFYGIAFFGIIATIGGLLDWKFHRDPLNLKIPVKERDAEALALGTGGIPLFILMALATLSPSPNIYLIPILLVLIYTVSIICYDEFVFHRKRCGPKETAFHRMLVFGNGLAWLCWMFYIYYK
ncbi:hypothetical protein GYB22_01215 [bacterium]|nr:hypothetical protein [bacterium]